MRRVPTVLAVVLLGSLGAAASAADGASDPLQSPECREALTALQAQEASAASAPAGRSDRRGRPALDPKLDAARRHAARNCLAGRADPPPRDRLATPPLVVPPVAGVPPPAPTSLPGVAIPPRSPSPAPLTSITSCDPAGCWTSDGARLNRVGPTLWGPRGACSVLGSVVTCP